MYEDSASKASRARRAVGCSESNVIADNDHFDRYTFGPRHLCGNAEVKAIAGVVFDHQEDSPPSGNRPDCSKDGVAIRRSKDLSDDRCTQHPNADVTRVRWLVATSSARNDCDLMVSSHFDVAAKHDLVSWETANSGLKNLKALKHFLDEVCRLVYELLHGGVSMA